MLEAIRVPTATSVLVAIVAVAGTALILLGLVPDAVLLGGFIPARLGGAIDFEGVRAVPVWLTPLSAALIPLDPIGLIFNVIFLALTARQVEKAVGAWGVAILAVVGAFVSAFEQALWAWNAPVPMAGAGGVVAAQIGACALLYTSNRPRAIGPFSPLAVQIAWLAAAWIALALLARIAGLGHGGLDNFILQIGGFLSGLLLAQPLLLWRWRHA